MGDIVVVGSVNMDVVNHVKNHPNLGETIEGISTSYSPGGKGANQAIAASLAGANVRMVGAVGGDTFASELVNQLKQFHVTIDSVLRKECTSGLAFITVDEHGNNTIILSRGANGEFSKTDLGTVRGFISSAGLLLLQNEIPWETTLLATRIAHENRVPVFFNPAPAVVPERSFLRMVDLIVLNENEAAAIANQSVKTIDEAATAANKLISFGVANVVVTLGDRGSVYIDAKHKLTYTPAFRVKPVDTTAAGDTFIGYLAALSWSGHTIESALRYASAASALSVMRSGAQNSIPGRDEVESFLTSAVPYSDHHVTFSQ